MTITQSTVDIKRYRWPTSIGLHLLPGLLFLAGCAAFYPVVRLFDLPASMGFTLGGLLLVTPFQIWYVRKHGLSFRHRLAARRLIPIVVGLVAFTALALAVMSPVTSFLDAHVFGGMPSWLLSSNDGLATVPLAVAVGCLLLNIVGDVILSPIAEELYYRGHLMARLPLGPLAAAAASAALFAATHFWEPAMIPFVFVVQTVLGLVVRKTGSVRPAIYTHIAVNAISTALTIAYVF